MGCEASAVELLAETEKWETEMTDVYHAVEWPHGLMCAAQSCLHIFEEGEEIREVFMNAQGDYYVTEIVCSECYGAILSTGRSSIARQ